MTEQPPSLPSRHATKVRAQFAVEFTAALTAIKKLDQRQPQWASRPQQHFSLHGRETTSQRMQRQARSPFLRSLHPSPVTLHAPPAHLCLSQAPSSQWTRSPKDSSQWPRNTGTNAMTSRIIARRFSRSAICSEKMREDRFVMAGLVRCIYDGMAHHMSPLTVLCRSMMMCFSFLSRFAFWNARRACVLASVLLSCLLSLLCGCCEKTCSYMLLLLS